MVLKMGFFGTVKSAQHLQVTTTVGNEKIVRQWARMCRLNTSPCFSSGLDHSFHVAHHSSHMWDLCVHYCVRSRRTAR
jgi:hypothetical protein